MWYNIPMPEKKETNRKEPRDSPTSRELKKLRDKILELDWRDHLRRARREDHRALGRKDLEAIGSFIERMDKNDLRSDDARDLKILGLLYEDLKGDFEKREALDIDMAESVDKVVEQLQVLIVQKKIRRWFPKEFSSLPRGNLKKDIARIERLGIKPEYVVYAKKRAPVAYVFLQAHRRTGDSAHTEETRSSQEQIKNQTKSMIDAGMIKHGFSEGLPYDDENDRPSVFTQKEAQEEAHDALAELKVEYGDAFVLYGVDDLNILADRVVEDAGAKQLRDFAFSGIVRNMVLADNLAEAIKQNPMQSFVMDIGTLHEKNLENVLGKGEHPLRISDLIALEGINVVVINTTNK